MEKKEKASLIHGIINLFLPLPVILVRHSGIEVDDPWKLFIPLVILTFAPLISDAIAIIIAGARLKVYRSKRILWGLALSLASIPLYIVLRFALKL